MQKTIQRRDCWCRGWPAVALCGAVLVCVPSRAADPQRPAMVQESLTTADGVQLAAAYLPGDKGKKTVPVVLLHAHKGSRDDWRGLALYLQSLGHAVLVPDLRGHGASTKTDNGSTLNPNNLNFHAMATHDMEAIASYLLAKNN